MNRPANNVLGARTFLKRAKSVQNDPSAGGFFSFMPSWNTYDLMYELVYHRAVLIVLADANCALLFGGVGIQRLKVVLSLRLVDTEQSLGPRFGGSRDEGVQYEA
jgi:hypothetical protein